MRDNVYVRSVGVTTIAASVCYGAASVLTWVANGRVEGIPAVPALVWTISALGMGAFFGLSYLVGERRSARHGRDVFWPDG